jgi:hypothetical protein
VVEEVGAAGAAVEVPGDDGVLGGGVHAAAPAPEHALPLEPLHEQQPHPRNAPPPPAAWSIDGKIRRSEPSSAGTLSHPQQSRTGEEKKFTAARLQEGERKQRRTGTGPAVPAALGSQETKGDDEEPLLSLKRWLPRRDATTDDGLGEGKEGKRETRMECGWQRLQPCNS